MEELIKQFRLLNPELEKFEINQIKDFWNILNNNEFKIDKFELLEFIRLVFKATEEVAVKQGISYDIDFIFQTDLVKQYKDKLGELGDMMSDLPNKVPVLFQQMKEFKDDLMKIGNQVALIIDTGFKGNPENLYRAFIADGYKLDPEGKITSFVYNSLYQGYDNFEDEYNSAKHGRISGIITADSIEKGGYIHRRMEHLFRFLNLSTEDWGCETSLTVDIDKNNLKKFIGRNANKNGKDFVIDKNTEDGTYDLYSPRGCKATGEGDVVCTKCMGKLSDNLVQFKKLSTIFSGLTETLLQRLLSSKHLLTVNLQGHPLVEYIGNNQWVIKDTSIVSLKNDYLIDVKDHTEIPFMMKTLQWVDEDAGIFTGDGEWRSVDTKSLLPLTEKVFNKSGSYKDIADWVEYYTAFINFDGVAKLGQPSLIYELIMTLITRSESDPRELWKNDQSSGYVIQSIHNTILKSGHLDSLFYERIKEQLSDPTLHYAPLDRNGGLWELYFREKGI